MLPHTTELTRKPLSVPPHCLEPSDGSTQEDPHPIHMVNLGPSIDKDLQDTEVAKPGRQEKSIHSKLGKKEERYLELSCSHHHPHLGGKLSS